MKLSNLLIEDDIIYTNDGTKMTFILKRNDRTFTAQGTTCRWIVDFKSISRYEHFEASDEKNLTYKIKVKLNELSMKARRNKDVTIIEDTIINLDGFGSYKIVYQGERIAFLLLKGYCTALKHTKIDHENKIIYAINECY